ncbi:uncharacterized protein LOC134240525 [Saccostrea cucullata]|uniref:uncharacterized protein LOC134240525 n=1 Tax=Saccostrea cuccullata TaxID=36930 RepID=UPI002ED4344B
MNFLNAHEICQIHGGILTDVPDEETDQMLSRYFGQDYWIGINDIYNEDQFVDMRNRSIVYKNWCYHHNQRYEQPNNWMYYNNTEIMEADCVRKHESGWFDDLCTFEYKAICSKKIALNCTTEMIKNPSSDIELWISEEATSFFKADRNCQAQNGTFAEITDNLTLQLLYETNENWSEIWIGAHDLVLEGYFMNIRNETQCFGREGWKTLIYNSDTSDCVAFNGSMVSKFVILPCDTELPVLCSSSYEDPVPSTTTTSTRPFYSTSTSLSKADSVPSTTITSSTTGVSTSVLQSTTDTVPSTTTKSTRTVGSTSVSTSTTGSVPATQTTSSTTGSSTSVSTSPSATLSTAVSSTLASTSATYSVPSTTTSSLKTVSFTLVSFSLSTSTPKSSSTVTSSSSSTDTFPSAHVSSSMSTTNLTKSTTATFVNKGCMCPCERMKNQVIITDKKVLIAKIAKMKKELKVNKADLNKQLRKRLSVFDKHASAVAVGTIFGPLVIAFFIGIIVISDIPIMMRHLKYGLCRKAGKKKRKRRIRSDDVRGCPVDVQKDKAGIQEQEMVDNPA